MLDLERAVLGAVLLNEMVWPEVARLLATDFDLDSNRRIFLCMAELARSEHPIDILTLVAELQLRGDLEQVGGEAYISDLVSGLPDRPLSDVADYVRRLQEQSTRRRAQNLLCQAQRLAANTQVPVEAVARLTDEMQCLAQGEVLPPRSSEEALALRFSRTYGKDLRYVSKWKRWMFWNGERWVEDSTMLVLDRARALSRQASAESMGGPITTATRLASKATSAAVECLARSDRSHAASPDQFDRNEWRLNTPQGTVDLRTGRLLAHDRADYITKVTAASPNGDCPLWRQFLAKVTDKDAALEGFLQRMVGYCLTGVTQEQKFFFLYGTGGNGKSVFLSTLNALLGDYAKVAPSSLFTAGVTQQHPTDLAGLLGARFVTATETEDGARWAEAKIKAITGGDKITARFIHQDFFEFTPQFKVLIAGNHKPEFRCVDEAMRRRIVLVPFSTTISAAERDHNLIEKLRSEFPGILAWVIQGCLAWQREGLNLPAVVCEATANYLSAQDALEVWLEERCEKKTDGWESSAELFSNWRKWCEMNGEDFGTQRRFAQKLEAKGFRLQRKTHARGFGGIVLRRSRSDAYDAS